MQVPEITLSRETERRGVSMVRIALLGLSLIVVGVDAGWAQDIAGIEDCTKTSGLDKRTGYKIRRLGSLSNPGIRNQVLTGTEATRTGP
jgi:hypothetical protein